MGKPLRVLIVDDSEDDATLLVEALKDGGYDLRFERVDTADAMALALKSHPWDIVVSDYSMPTFSALGALDVLKRTAADVPCIIMSGSIGEDRAVELLKEGASDFITKGLTLRLLPAIKRELLEAEERRARKVAEKALSESELKFQSLCESAADAIISANSVGEICSWNKGAEKIFGYCSRDIVGNSLEIIMPERYRKRHQEALDLIRASGGLRFAGKTLEVYGLRKDGTEVPLEVSLSHWKTRSEDCFGAIIRDITERKRTEEAMIEKACLAALSADVGASLTSENSLTTILHSCVEAVVRNLSAAFARIWTLNEQDQVLELQASAGMYTHIDGPHRRVPVGKFKIGLIAQEKKAHLTNDVQNDSRVSDKTWAKREGMISFAGYPLMLDDRLVGVLAMFARRPLTDFTIKALGTIADSIALGINRKITENAKANLEAQLRQAQKMEAIGQLAGGIAHDFNNLLTVINGRSQLLMNRFKPGEKTRTDLELIYKTGERAAGLTRQLLAFSRQQILQSVVLDLNIVAGNLDNMLRRLIREDIELETVLDPALKRVKADPSQIEQIILNLVVNARDAMPDGGKLTIETSNVELSEEYCRIHGDAKPGQYVMLAVSDTGCGMGATVRARIFEPFFTTKPQGKGTGLGLAMVFGVVKQSNGQIEVYSEVGKGTTFKIYLPQTQEPIPSAAASQLAVPVGHEVILVVEDEEGVRSLVQDLLEMNGYTVLTANNGNEALQVFEKHKDAIHLLITDVVMPEMGGPELVARIKVQHPETKSLFTSGYTDHAIVRNGELEAGVAFIQKPFTPANLARKVREVLDKQ
jgi:PAS domain S-box-containing protein